MKRISALVLLAALSTSVLAQNLSNVPAVPAQAAPAAVATPAPASSSASAVLVTVPSDQVVQAPVLAPPAWVQDLAMSAESFPTVGPILVLIFKYLSIFVTILTALCACVIAVLKSLSGIASLANLSSLAVKIQTFENGPIMYYLKYASAFNAQKPADTAAKQA